ncbi:MAG: hypothetical protein QOG03_1542, partial [Actinomycetota bacterium]|nr:hypothetical protein [Actinomycetota bacterium]
YVGIGPQSGGLDPNQQAGPQVLEQFAVSALRIMNVPQGATITLSLDVAPNQNADTVSQVPQPATIDACGVDTAGITWDGIQGGPWVNHPKWDCDTDFIAAETGNGGKVVTWTFPAGRMVDANNTLDIVLVPRGSVPFQLGFQPPDEQSFDIEGGTTGSEFGPDAGGGADTSGFDAGLSSGDLALGDTGLGDLGVGLDPSTSGLGAVATTTPTSRAGNGAGRTVPVGAALPKLVDTRGERIMAVGLLLALAAALWWVGGQPTRLPRLLGSVGGGSPPDPGTGASLGGLGRFARPRKGRPNRL